MYQKNLYRHYDINGFDILPLRASEGIVIDDIVKQVGQRRAVFHQHWLTPIFFEAIDLESGYNEVDLYIAKLITLKSMGVKICWTVHNLIEHDLDAYQIKINMYLLHKISLVSDVIFIHNYQAAQSLIDKLNLEISEEKFFALPHSLYDDSKCFKNLSLPPEIKTNIQDSKILLISGQIKPYKGVQELIKAIRLSIKEFLELKIHLIVAGVVLDDTVLSMLNELKEEYPSLVSIIPRRVSDEEMAGLLNYADLVVLPYRAVLTSGSYYAAATFAVPVLAPSFGMFTEVIDDSKNGFVYDGTIDGLASKLLNVMQLTKIQLKEIGQNAYFSNKDNTIEQVSNIYFQKINKLFNTNNS